MSTIASSGRRNWRKFSDCVAASLHKPKRRSLILFIRMNKIKERLFGLCKLAATQSENFLQFRRPDDAIVLIKIACPRAYAAPFHGQAQRSEERRVGREV